MWNKENRILTWFSDHCPMHSLNGGCWEDSVIRIENIFVICESIWLLYFLHIMLLSVSLSCQYVKHTFALPLSKSGVTCLGSCVFIFKSGSSKKSFKSYIHLLKSCFTLTCQVIRHAFFYCSSLHSNTDHWNSDNRKFGRTKLSILSISGLSVISLFPFSL